MRVKKIKEDIVFKTKFLILFARAVKFAITALDKLYKTQSQDMQPASNCHV